MEKSKTNPKAIYRKKRIMIPTPKFFVFYNGKDPFPSEKIMKLSDSYLEKKDSPMLELIVKVININLSNKHELLEQCRPLYEYSWFIQRVKDYENEGMIRDDAITRAIRDCKQADIMAEFMYEHGSEVANMLFGEYDEELAKEVAREEGYEDGWESGLEHGLERGLKRGELQTLIQMVSKKLIKGKSPEVIADELETNLETINRIYDAVQSHGADLKKLLAILEK